jgi:hypothetical protein
MLFNAETSYTPKHGYIAPTLESRPEARLLSGIFVASLLHYSAAKHLLYTQPWEIQDDWVLQALPTGAFCLHTGRSGLSAGWVVRVPLSAVVWRHGKMSINALCQLWSTVTSAG